MNRVRINIFIMICALITLIFFTGISNKYVAASPELPSWIKSEQFRNMDSNYIRVGLQQGYEAYIKINTINVLEYSPPVYKIKGLIVTFDPKDRLTYEKSVTWRYVWSEYETDRRMFRLVNNEWEEISLSNLCTANASSIVGGEIAWYVAYKMDFYGNPYHTD